MKKTSFIARRGGLLALAILHVLVSAGVCAIYGTPAEYSFYICAIAAIFWVLVLCSLAYSDAKQNREVQLLEQQLSEKAAEDKADAYWKVIREKEDFFTLWAHQIKTPIAALEVLLQSNPVEASECRRELLRIENYVGMALNYTRFDNMSSDLRLENCRVEDVVRPLVKKYATMFIHNHLSVDLEGLDVVILTDEKWFTFVLEQILSNALKYTREGGIRICARAAEDGLEVGVIDTGIGIRAEDLPRLFERGYTGYNGRLDKKASGLGLYLCKGICDKLGHGLKVTSTVGQGTEVWISCPAAAIAESNLTKM